MIVYHQRKAINTNIAVLANTLHSIDLIAALADCGLLSSRRTSHYQWSWQAVPHCALGLFLISLGPALQRHPSPCSMTDCCNYSCILSDGNCAPAAHQIVLGFKSEIWTYSLPDVVILILQSCILKLIMTLLMIMKMEKKRKWALNCKFVKEVVSLHITIHICSHVVNGKPGLIFGYVRFLNMHCRV